MLTRDTERTGVTGKHVHAYMSIHTIIHTYIRTYLHTYTHTHIHTYTTHIYIYTYMRAYIRGWSSAIDAGHPTYQTIDFGRACEAVRTHESDVMPVAVLVLSEMF